MTSKVWRLMNPLKERLCAGLSNRLTRGGENAGFLLSMSVATKMTLRSWSSTDVPKNSEWYSPVVEILERLAIPWALAGALAANRYRAVPRASLDVDIYIEWNDSLVPALEDAGYTVRQLTDVEIDHPHLLVLRRGEDRVDLLVTTVEYQRLALSRAKENVLTVEDVIVHKLLAWRPRDRDDVRSILDAGHVLDLDYIEHWAREWEVLDRWRKARGEE
ncbi:MAG: hypothetical protein ACRD1T_00380 [Acidimicrobiia bacterium]